MEVKLIRPLSVFTENYFMKFDIKGGMLCFWESYNFKEI